jgi:hypothetical protein
MSPVGRRDYSSASVGIAVTTALITLGTRDARAEDAKAAPPISVAMQCERAMEAGRVKCSVEAKTVGGRTIAWADVTLVALPDFASALKGRIAPADVTLRDPSRQKWAFGLVARKNGEGEARARVRAVVCEPATSDASAPKCVPTTVDVLTTVRVG